jgi:hypothetical protein
MADQSLWGFSAKDAITSLIALVVAGMGFIFRNQNSRIKLLEIAKADVKAVEEKFSTIVKRLDRQDDQGDKRDEKLDRILERLSDRRGR